MVVVVVVLSRAAIAGRQRQRAARRSRQIVRLGQAHAARQPVLDEGRCAQRGRGSKCDRGRWVRWARGMGCRRPRAAAAVAVVGGGGLEAHGVLCRRLLLGEAARGGGRRSNNSGHRIGRRPVGLVHRAICGVRSHQRRDVRRARVRRRARGARARGRRRARAVHGWQELEVRHRKGAWGRREDESAGDPRDGGRSGSKPHPAPLAGEVRTWRHLRPLRVCGAQPAPCPPPHMLAVGINMAADIWRCACAQAQHGAHRKGSPGPESACAATLKRPPRQDPPFPSLTCMTLPIPRRSGIPRLTTETANSTKQANFN